jgi:polyphosphate kinase
VGRFLEHSRIYSFGNEQRGVDYYIGSADMMPRNLDRRVEVLVPVLDPSQVDRLAHIMKVELSDDVLAWQLDADAIWTKVPTVNGINTHQHLMDDALALTQPASIAGA